MLSDKSVDAFVEKRIVILESQAESERISSEEIKIKLEEYKKNLRDKDLVKC